MKISPIAGPTNTVAQADSHGTPNPGMSHNIRAITMRTNANPTYINPQAQELAGAVPINPLSNETEARASEDTQPISPQFAALARQKRALQVKEREIQDRERALQSSGQNGVDLAQLKSDPLGVLLNAGVTYEQLTDAILNNQGNSEVNALKAKIAELEQGVEKKFSDRDSQAEQQALAEMRREVKQLADSDDEFELIRGTRSYEDVTTLIERIYKESGEVLDVREAMTLVENELMKEAEKIAGFKKVQSKFASPQPNLQQQHRMRTLTNQHTAQPMVTPRQRALAAFWGQNK